MINNDHNFNYSFLSFLPSLFLRCPTSPLTTTPAPSRPQRLTGSSWQWWQCWCLCLVFLLPLWMIEIWQCFPLLMVLAMCHSWWRQCSFSFFPFCCDCGVCHQLGLHQHLYFQCILVCFQSFGYAQSFTIPVRYQI